MELNDKIKGAIVGFALGDALGLGTEFMSRHEVRGYYPGGLRRFSQIIRDSHRVQWKRGEWTNDTAIVCWMLETILREGKFDIKALARECKRWFETDPKDLLPIYRSVCTVPGYVDNPLGISQKVWREGSFDATNDAIQRSVVTGITSPRKRLIEDTRKLVQLTNDDTRCIATTTMIAIMCNVLMFEEREPQYEVLLEICRNIDPRTMTYVTHAHDGDIESRAIDDEDTMTWTRKAMAAGLWGYWHSDNAADAIYKVVDLGGDADSNASLSGAMAGIKYGYDALPDEKGKIIGIEYLLDLSDRVTEYVKKNVIENNQ